MLEHKCKLYVDNETYGYSSFEEAKEAAKKHMPSKKCLRIEILIEVGEYEADWWAYEYENNQWAPS